MNLLLVAVALMAGITNSNAADFTFTDDFEDGSVDSGWSLISPATAPTLTETGGYLTVGGLGIGDVLGALGLTTHSTLAINPAAPSFSISVDFTVGSVATGDMDWAGLAWNVGSTQGRYYTFRVRTENGRVTLSSFNDDNTGQANLRLTGGTNPDADLGALNTSHTYRMTVSSTTAGTFTAVLGNVTTSTTLINWVNLSGTAYTGGKLAIYSLGNETGDVRYQSFTGTVDVPESGPLALTNFSYDAATGNSEVSIRGSANTAYKLVEADDLDFTTSDPVTLTGATVGSLSGNEVTTDGNGHATVQFNLGTTKDASFIRAETP